MVRGFSVGPCAPSRFPGDPGLAAPTALADAIPRCPAQAGRRHAQRQRRSSVRAGTRSRDYRVLLEGSLARVGLDSTRPASAKPLVAFTTRGQRRARRREGRATAPMPAHARPQRMLLRARSRTGAARRLATASERSPPRVWVAASGVAIARANVPEQRLDRTSIAEALQSETRSAETRLAARKPEKIRARRIGSERWQNRNTDVLLVTN